MNVTFQDLQQLDNEMNGTRLTSVLEVASLFRSLAGRNPFMFALRGDNGFMLTVGLASDCASVQYSPADGLPPYLMAVANDGMEDGGLVEFLAGNTPTAIPRRFCLPIKQVVEITSVFVTNGSKSESVSWEEI